MKTRFINQSLKCHKGRGIFSTQRNLFLLFFIFAGICAVSGVNARLFGFDCKKDVLDKNTVRVPEEASSLILGQQCAVSVFDRKGKKFNDKDFIFSSNNEYVMNSGLTFSVDNRAKGSPWMHIDGSLVEIDGKITIAAKKCNKIYSFPFKVRQTYPFDHEISYKSEKKEFAVARYKNSLGVELFAVMDINRNQLHLLEAPISIDASGARGKDGSPGSAGKSGANGTVNSQNGGHGGEGGRGEDGDDGGDGGEITVYLPNNIQGISVNIEGGEGGRGGKGGKGGKGGNGYSVKTGEKGALGLPKYEKLGKDGQDGYDGRDGKDGRRGRDGILRKVQVDDIKKYFTNVNQKNFNINDIDE